MRQKNKQQQKAKVKQRDQFSVSIFGYSIFYFAWFFFLGLQTAGMMSWLQKELPKIKICLVRQGKNSGQMEQGKGMRAQWGRLPDCCFMQNHAMKPKPKLRLRLKLWNKCKSKPTTLARPSPAPAPVPAPLWAATLSRDDDDNACI